LADRSRWAGRWHAFTLIELLVVIGIFLLLLAIAVPAFSSMLRSSEESLAENALRGGLAAARDAAARGPAGQDAVALFMYDHETRRTMILPCISAGKLLDSTPAGQQTPVEREVFAPLSGYEPVQLPRGWSVRGFAPAGMLIPNADRDWYEDTYAAVAPRNGRWVFPETTFLDVDAGDQGQFRQSFVVRFEGGTGLVKMSDLSGVLVFSPVSGGQFRASQQPWRDHRGDQAEDYVKFIKGVLARPASGTGSVSLPDRRLLLGNGASDTILCKPVGQLAVYQEKRLAAALGVRLDARTETIYRNPEAMGTPMPQLLTGVSLDALDAWIVGFTAGGQPVDTDCRVFSIQRYLGSLQEVTGSRQGQGVQGGGI
jgi:prepilin-type N-terminal cleavage/methylation domain-containing protein